MQEAINVVNLNLSDISSAIILIGALVVAIKNIYSFFKKPVNDLQAKAKKEEEKHIEEVLEQKMPALLAQHSERVKGERKTEDKCMAESITNKVIKVVDDKIEELMKMTKAQDSQLSDISNSITLLNQSQLDMLRYDMNKLYYKYRPYKKMLSADKKAFMKLYHDYKMMDGNTWIDALYAEVVDWPIVEDQEELKAIPKNGEV